MVSDCRRYINDILPEILNAINGEYFFKDAVIIIGFIFVGAFVDIPECPVEF